MEQHPIPRQITTFEFKLIGFLTIKQFIYLILFMPMGFIVYSIFPIPLLNILLGVLTGAAGFALAFVPINDRPLDVWIKNFIKRMTSPTQYLYHKQNHPLYFLQDLYFLSDPHRVVTHIESKDKLASYLTTKNTVMTPNTKKQSVANLFQATTATLTGKQHQEPIKQPELTEPPQTTAPAPSATPPVASPKKPFFTGIVKNHKLIPIPGILVYVKDEKNTVLRLLKTNPHGVFATFNPLPEGEYTFEIKDANNSYIFDTMKIKIEAVNTKPIEIMSKELL